MYKQEFIPTIKIDPERCDKEGLCVLACVEDIFEQKEKKAFPNIVHPEACFSCGQCLAICPSDAITHTGLEPLETFTRPSPETKLNPEHLIGFMRSRRSIRLYNQKRSVRRELIEKIIDSARYAPTGSNAQSLEHIVITDRDLMDRLAALGVDLFREKAARFEEEGALSHLDPRFARRIEADIPFYKGVVSDYEAGKDPFFYQAPVLVITHADMTITSCPTEDATIASYQMILVALSLGLGSCYVGNLYEFGNESPEIRELLDIPPDNDILMSFVLGYPAIRFRRLVGRKEAKVRWIDE
ncbi:MAG: 4Fe-4S binding protein [Chloroflexi bacterium]|jgi:nitroreductase/NAD-dependent dihydropyrimidine dehydrogenase PreA subunit|nr:4Fe-4S binding protein [Chloroflexota bacterium]